MTSIETAGVAPQSPPCMLSTPPNGIISLLKGRLLVLSCEAEIAAHYTDHTPLSGQFSVVRPYQQPAAAALTLPAQTNPGPTSDATIPQPSAGGHFNDDFNRQSAEELPMKDSKETLSPGLSGSEGIGSVDVTPRVRRKRKGGLRREPNIAEQQVKGPRLLVR